MDSPSEFRVPTLPLPATTPRLKRRSVPQPASTTPISPSTSPMKPTSSLARRRRSLIATTNMSNMLQRVVTDPGPPTAPLTSGGGSSYFGDDDDEVMTAAAAVVAEPEEAEEMETEFDNIEQAMTLLSLHPVPQQAHWPDPEELLKESLRQSLSALRTLREAKRIIRGTETPTFLEVEGLFESVLADLRAGREALGWAEQQMEMEKGVLRERLLKG